MDDPLLRDMVATIIRAYLETYPNVDYLHVSMPEHRSWIGQAKSAFEKLSTQYQLEDLGSYEELCARARRRASFPGGGKRVETMLKGDLSSIWFFDSLLKEKKLLKRPQNPYSIERACHKLSKMPSHARIGEVGRSHHHSLSGNFEASTGDRLIYN